MQILLVFFAAAMDVIIVSFRFLILLTFITYTITDNESTLTIGAIVYFIILNRLFYSRYFHSISISRVEKFESISSAPTHILTNIIAIFNVLHFTIICNIFNCSQWIINIDEINPILLLLHLFNVHSFNKFLFRPVA